MKDEVKDLEERIRILISQCSSVSAFTKESVSRQIIDLSIRYKELTGQYFDIGKTFGIKRNEALSTYIPLNERLKLEDIEYKKSYREKEGI